MFIRGHNAILYLDSTADTLDRAAWACIIYWYWTGHFLASSNAQVRLWSCTWLDSDFDFRVTWSDLLKSPPKFFALASSFGPLEGDYSVTGGLTCPRQAEGLGQVTPSYRCIFLVYIHMAMVLCSVRNLPCVRHNGGCRCFQCPKSVFDFGVCQLEYTKWSMMRILVELQLEEQTTNHIPHSTGIGLCIWSHQVEWLECKPKFHGEWQRT